jgi:diguanylate cyclase (GGDEF)-like protein
MSTKAKILLVDDVPANLHTLSHALMNQYDLSVTTSGASALALAEQTAPDLILMDVMMPEMDGLETLRRLRQSDWGQDIPVILVTADDRTETQVFGLDQGADDFIAKPVVVPVVQARVRNVLDRQRLRRELIRLATTDELTGALNRRHFFELGEAEHSRIKRYQQPCGLLMLDIDYFKPVNDQYGHAAGDAVLKAFVETIQGLLRQSDALGRLGGEEFAVLLPQTEQEGTLELAERLRGVVEALCVDTENGNTISVTTSLGATQLHATDRRFDEALQRADTALYAAKDGGRNRVRLAEHREPHS